jgi:membrane-associated phospholipid phosphatase
LFKGFTRITDNRHHDTDVLAGGILGTVIAIIAVRKFYFS